LKFQDKKHLKDGVLQVTWQGKARERFVVLFTDSVLICKILAAHRDCFKYELEFAYSLAELMPQKQSAKLGTLQFSVLTSEDNDLLMLSHQSEDQIVSWGHVLQNCFKDIREEHRSAARNTYLRQSSFTDSQASTGGSRRQHFKMGSTSRNRATARKTILETSFVIHSKTDTK
jgi:hypothetical protein